MTAIVLLVVIAAGAFLIHRLNSGRGDRITAFHYGRDGVAAQGPDGRPGRLRFRSRHHDAHGR